nr:hypothetical protein BaRGS_018041 [Batillaria attramentaria]
MATGLALQPGNRYRFAVKLYLEVTFETFKDPDVTDLTSSQRVMYSYEWTLTDRSQGQRLLQPWQTVPTVETVNNTHSRFTVSVPSALSFHECLGVSLRGMNKAGLVSEVTADVMDCQAVDPALIVPRQVLDAVGSVPAGEDVLKYADVGLTNHVTLHGLRLQDGHTYYVTIQAEDHVGRTISAISNGFVADSSAPQRTTAQFRFAQSYITSDNSVSLCWEDMFVDAESGIDSYIVSMGSRPGHDDVMIGQTVTAECGEFTTDVTLVNGHAYYVTVKAVNGAGLQSRATSPAITVMTTSPTVGHVFDGQPPSEVNWSHAGLHEGILYFTTVTACNDVDQCTEVTSDGVMIDVTAPVKGTVWDGTGDVDIAFQAQRPPQVVRAPALSRGLGTLDNLTLVSRDALSVSWEIQDTDSQVETQFVSLASHQLGEFESRPTQPESEKEKFFAPRRGSNLTSRIGMFAVDTDHAADLRRHIDGWMSWSSNSLKLAWLGFHDLHSGIDHYEIRVGTTPFATDLLPGDTFTTVSHSESGTSYEDEGFVQMYHVTTETLNYGDSIYIAVWAVNGVGLRSHPALSRFDLEEGGGMSLRRRCTSYSCLAQCVCAVQGGTCASPTPCTVYSADRSLNPKLSYSTFVRCWYPDGSYTVFKSPGIIPLVRAPGTTNQVGRAVKEHAASNQEKDVDFVTSSDTVHITWKGKFISTSSPIQTINVYIGTTPEAHDVHSSGVLPPSAESYQASGLQLAEDTLYYTTVVAWGEGGMVSWAVSDGFMLDTTSPGAGVVVDGLTPGAVYRFTVRLAYPATLMAHHRPLSGHVTLGRERHAFELDPRMCRGVCDAVEEPVIMWHHTTVASGEQQLAVDHAELLHVQYVQEPGALNTNALSTGAVFLPQWSVVQASWHFTDAESTIVDYQWALGLTSVAYSEPLVTDMTPPVISDLVDGSGTDVDFQTGNVISATWTASDSESGVANCQWAIASLTLPQTVYVSVRCYNRAGLPAHDVTDGVTIVAIDNDQSLGSLQLLADGVTHYPAQETCHVLQDRLRLRWSNLGSTIPTSGFQVGYSANGIAATDNTPSLPYLLESARIQDINFARDTLYDVTLTTIDIRDVLGSKVNKTTHLKPDAPSVKGTRA